MLHFTQQKSKNRIIVYAPMRPNPIHETHYLQKKLGVSFLQNPTPVVLQTLLNFQKAHQSLYRLFK